MAVKLRLLKPYLPLNMNLNPGLAASWVQSSHREIPIFSGGARRAVHELSHLNSEKIGLPKSRVLYTVLRSPHIDKKSREQFHMGIKKQILVTKSQRHELRNKYFWLMRQRIFGAQCEIQFSYKTRLGVRKFSTLRPSKSFIEHPTTGFDQCSVSPFSLKGIKNAESEKMTMVRQICHTALKGDHEFINTVQEGTEETHAQVRQTHLVAPFHKHFSRLYFFLKEHIADDVDYKVGRASHVEMKNKETAYQAWLGYYNSNKKVGRDKHRLVEVATEFSRRMGLDNPLAIPKLILGKMGL